MQEVSTDYSLASIANPLISIGKLCDDDCVTLFVNEDCYVLKNTCANISPFHDNAFLVGDRDHDSKLWLLSLQANIPKVSVNTIYEMKLKELISFHHRALFSPTKDTWLKAMKKGYFTT